MTSLFPLLQFLRLLVKSKVWRNNRNFPTYANCRLYNNIVSTKLFKICLKIYIQWLKKSVSLMSYHRLSYFENEIQNYINTSMNHIFFIGRRLKRIIRARNSRIVDIEINAWSYSFSWSLSNILHVNSKGILK